MDVSGYHHSGSITVKRPPADVYAIVSDVTRIGDLSPVCQSCAWDDPAQAGKEGAWFTGHNAIGDYTWDTSCRVVTAGPPRGVTLVHYRPPHREGEAVPRGSTLGAGGG